MRTRQEAAGYGGGGGEDEVIVGREIGKVLHGGVEVDGAFGEGGGHAVDEGLGAGAQGGEDGVLGGAVGAVFCLKGEDERAVFALHLDEGGHDGADGEGLDVASEDAGEQGCGEGLEDLVAEVAEDEVGYGFVWMVVGSGFKGVLAEFGGAVGFGVVGGDGFGGEERGVFEGGEVCGDHHAHAVGDGEELAVAQDPGDAAFVEGWGEFVRVAEGSG